MLTKIGVLFKNRVISEEEYIRKMLKRIDKSKYYSKASHLQKVNIIDQYFAGTAVLEKTGNLVFFDERDVSCTSEFDIDGCNVESCCELVGSILRLKNKKSLECYL